jgi:hypothetical protein
MNTRLLAAAYLCALAASGAGLAPPKAGKTEILPLKDLKPGMQATAWTVFSGMTPEPVPVEIVGVWKNAIGPRMDVIIGKMGGRAKETNVAAGMSGSPVYVDGKLIGAVALRLSVFSPDAICGITPIESMLEINDFDTSHPPDAKTPDKLAQKADASTLPSEIAAQFASAGGLTGTASPGLGNIPLLQQIDTPLVFSGFTQSALQQFEPLFGKLGITAVQGGSSTGNLTAKPAPGWESALNPGEAVSGILVSGDMSVTGMGTVTYNDGKRVLAFGHPFYNIGPIDMPMAKSEILMVLSSAYQPTKFGNATEVVGALRQDRYSGIAGELGAEAASIPVHVKLRALGAGGATIKEKDLNFNVFVQQSWTPRLMTMTLLNALSQMNEYADDLTYRMRGDVELDGASRIQVGTILAPTDAPVPAPMALATWWGDKFNRLFYNPVAQPNLKRVDVTIDMLPERRLAAVDSAWTPSTEVEAGNDIPVKVFLRPYRGGRIERSLTVKIPSNLPKGEHRILFSDAATLNLMQNIASASNRYLDIPETVSLLNQERSNNNLYVSVMQNRSTFYADDKSLPALPASILNVLQTERTTGRSLMGTTESAVEQLAVPFDQMVTGSYSLRIVVK